MPSCRSVPAAAMPPMPAPTIATLGVAMILLLLIVERPEIGKDLGDRRKSPSALNIDLATRYVKYIFGSKLIFYKYEVAGGGPSWCSCFCVISWLSPRTARSRGGLAGSTWSNRR